jgi:hypothetical protein
MIIHTYSAHRIDFSRCNECSGIYVCGQTNVYYFDYQLHSARVCFKPPKNYPKSVQLDRQLTIYIVKHIYQLTNKPAAGLSNDAAFRYFS